MSQRHTVKSCKLEEQRTLCRSLTVVKRPARASKSSRLRLRGLPTPVASLMASNACSKPSHRSQVKWVKFESPGRNHTVAGERHKSAGLGLPEPWPAKGSPPRDSRTVSSESRQDQDRLDNSHAFSMPNLQGSYDAWNNTKHSSV